ncbi:hypothetical protein J6590_093684 [Homalodisca vitripennis]|nr:hypothetical protein J6590_093684 [Homalodisca vitripennis]
MGSAPKPTQGYWMDCENRYSTKFAPMAITDSNIHVQVVVTVVMYHERACACVFTCQTVKVLSLKAELARVEQFHVFKAGQNSLISRIAVKSKGAPSKQTVTLRRKLPIYSSTPNVSTYSVVNRS